MKCKKVKYGSKLFADRDIERIKNKSDRNTVPQRSYKCNECGGWHLTSQPVTFMWHGQKIEIKTKANENN